MKTKRQFRVIPNYSRYEISDDGMIIRHIKFDRSRKLVVRQGYASITLIDDNGIVRTPKVHRLVYSAFVGELIGGMEIDHINRVRLDNRVENLRQVTKQENLQNRGKRGVDIDTISLIVELALDGMSSEEIYGYIRK